MSCSEEPLNTSNPWGQISQASFPLLGLAPGLVSMATQDASTSSLAPLPALPLGKRSSWQLPGQKPLVYSVHVGVHRALVGSLKPTSAVITGFFETSLSLGVQIWESKHQFGGRVLSCWSQWESPAGLYHSQPSTCLPHSPASNTQKIRVKLSILSPTAPMPHPHRIAIPQHPLKGSSGSALVGELNEAVSILLGSQRSELDRWVLTYIVFVITAPHPTGPNL